MATTTAFGWSTPDDTSLVKDGAAAIRTLGSSIDTSMAELKGGTTGQVLSKTSNTDMDFTWVAADDTNAIQNAIVDAKGDLIAASANDTPARLAVGANGETLVADSSTATGLRYQAPVNANPVLNSAMQVFQRGTSFSIAASSVPTYTADRWQVTNGANQAITVSRQATGDTTNLPFIQYATRFQRNSGQTGTTAMLLTQSLETINSIPYAGKTVTMSFYARAGANYSAASNGLTAVLYSGTGTDQNITGAYTGATAVFLQTATLTTTWQRFTYTGAVGSTATELALLFQFTPTGTASTNDYFEITGVMVEVGSVATPFKTYGATIQGETSACQRYYWRTSNPLAFSVHGVGVTLTSTDGYFSIPYPVTMRVSPTLVEGANLRILDSASTAYTVSSVINAQNSATAGYVQAFSTTMTAGRSGFLQNNNSTSGYIAFGAEL